MLLFKPAETSPDAFYTSLMERLLTILRDTGRKVGSPPPPALVRASAFVITRFVATSPSQADASLPPLLHAAFAPMLQAVAEPDPDSGLDPVVASSSALRSSVHVMATLVANAPPSPSLQPFVITPILPQLFAIMIGAGTDPVVRQEAEELLIVWLRGASPDAATAGLVKTIERLESSTELPDGAYWARSDDGGICIRQRTAATDETMWEPRPDADRFVALLQRAERKDVQAELFLRWLDELRELDGVDDVESSRRCVERIRPCSDLPGPSRAFSSSSSRSSSSVRPCSSSRRRCSLSFAMSCAPPLLRQRSASVVRQPRSR